MVQILERVQAHYENREMPFGKVYVWNPAYVVLDCDCGEKVTLSATSTTTTCGRCGADLGAFVYEMRTPARTRAAERISDAGELLRRERYERALTVAMQAIDDDPNNPAGFLAAAWASLRVDDHERAREFFREATQASDGDRRQGALRQAARLTFLLEGPQGALRELGVSPGQLSPAEEAATDFDRAVYLSNAGESTAAAECIRKTSYDDGRFCLMALTDPFLSRDATVAETAAEQLRAIREQLADPIVAEVHRAHARYEALWKEIEDLGLAEAVWNWRERREKWWQNILQVELPKLAYWGLNALPRAQAFARDVHAFVDQDERALGKRRAEWVLNEYIACEEVAGWRVVGRSPLHAGIYKWGLWSSKAKGYMVKFDPPSGQVISTKVDAWNAPDDPPYRNPSVWVPCEYCWREKLIRGQGVCESCNGAAGELELW